MCGVTVHPTAGIEPTTQVSAFEQKLLGLRRCVPRCGGGGRNWSSDRAGGQLWPGLSMAPLRGSIDSVGWAGPMPRCGRRAAQRALPDAEQLRQVCDDAGLDFAATLAGRTRSG